MRIIIAGYWVQTGGIEDCILELSKLLEVLEYLFLSTEPEFGNCSYCLLKLTKCVPFNHL